MYRYYVAYAFRNGGFGGAELSVPGPVDSYDKVKGLTEVLGRQYPGLGTVVVLNFILLAGPES